jgi:hypothetical protein
MNAHDETISQQTEFDPIDRMLLRRLRLTEIQALLVCDALKSVKLGPDLAKLLWSDVERAIISQRPDRKNEMDGEALTDRLQRLNDGEAVALLRAVEWFWQQDSLPAKVRLQAIGLN